MWRTANKLRGKIPPANANSNIDAYTFNSYFASISNSSNYIEPTHKLSAPHNISYIRSSTVFYILDKNCPKGAGSDGLSGWFLKLIYPAICEPLSTIYNNCIKQAFFPAQWENSIIKPVKKINNPIQSISSYFHHYLFINSFHWIKCRHTLEMFKIHGEQSNRKRNIEIYENRFFRES